MNPLSAAAAIVLFASSTFAQSPAADHVPGDLEYAPTLMLAGAPGETPAQSLQKYHGKVVRLQFTHRLSEPLKKDRFGTVARIKQSLTKNGSSQEGECLLLVPPAGMAWLNRLPTMQPRDSQRTEFVIVRITSIEPIKAEAIGREIRKGAKDLEAVW